MKKLFLILLILIGVLYLYLSYQTWFKTDSFKVIFFDVGQGDSTLIITPGGKTILIDGGPDTKVLRGLGDALPFWWRQIDLVVITHAHDDHTAGLIEVSRRYKIKQILYNNLNNTTPTLDSLLKIFKEQQTKMISANPGMSFNFNHNCSLNILAASKEPNLDENDYSIATSFNCLNKKVLLTGDAGIKIEQELLSQNINLQSDIFKISHHGSLTANSEAFLKAVKARVAAISVGINNKFNHPAAAILNRLQNLPVDIHRTDKVGTIEFLANNNTIKLIK